MEVDVSKQSLTINKLIGTKTKTVTIEGDMIVPDVKPDILSTIDSVGNICIYKKEVLDGRVRYDGGINVYLIYLADSETDITRGLNTTLDFTQMVDMDECKQDMDIMDNMQIKNIECNVLNGRKINIKVEVEISIQLFLNQSIEVLKEINNVENVQTLNSKMTINTLVGKGTTKTIAKDTIACGENLAEVLKAEVNIVNKEEKTSYNKVLVKADAATKIMYLTESNEIKIINSNIPIMGFIDISDVSEENIINTNYEIKNMLIKPNNDENHSIYVEIEVGISCMAYGTSDIELIQDMYSVEDDIEFTTKPVLTETNKINKRSMCDISEKISVPEISNNQIYDVEINPVINNTNILNGRIVFEGELNLNFIFASSTTIGIEAKKYKLPFNYEMEDECINSEKRVTVQTECVGDNFVVLADGMIECKVNIQFSLEMSDSADINIIDEIKLLENRNVQNYSMVIYLVKPGDTLWKIAKRYKTTVSNIMELNNLENDNIKVGDKLYIQRYKNNKIGISA